MKIFEARRPGNQTYTKAQLLTILNTAVGSGNSADASLILADQLIAARLSIANGSDPAPISATIATADARLATFSGRPPYKVKPSSAIGQQMTALAALLDQYNKGLLTLGARRSQEKMVLQSGVVTRSRPDRTTPRSRER